MKKLISLMMIFGAISMASGNPMPCYTKKGCVEHYFYQQTSWVRNLFKAKTKPSLEKIKTKSEAFWVKGTFTELGEHEGLFESDISGTTQKSRNFVVTLSEETPAELEVCTLSDIYLKVEDNGKLAMKEFICLEM